MFEIVELIRTTNGYPDSDGTKSFLQDVNASASGRKKCRWSHFYHRDLEWKSSEDYDGPID